jgi:predicted nucleic-acid-binding Zn-ribbon protein
MLNELANIFDWSKNRLKCAKCCYTEGYSSKVFPKIKALTRNCDKESTSEV